MMFYFAPKYLQIIYIGDNPHVYSNYGVKVIETNVMDDNYFRLDSLFKSIQGYFHKGALVTGIIPIVLLYSIEEFSNREKYYLMFILLLNAFSAFWYTKLFLKVANPQSRALNLNVDNSLWALLLFLNYFILKFLFAKLNKKKISMSNGLLIGLIFISLIELILYQIIT